MTRPWRRRCVPGFRAALAAGGCGGAAVGVVPLRRAGGAGRGVAAAEVPQAGVTEGQVLERGVQPLPPLAFPLLVLAPAVDQAALRARGRATRSN